MKTSARIGRPIFAALALTALITPAHAQVAPGLPDLPMPQAKRLPSADEFADLQVAAFDKDRNGKVSWDEFSAKLRAAFNDMDKKKRGYITREDIKEAYIKAVIAMPRQADSE
jgi:hypothetical protein